MTPDPAPRPDPRLALLEVLEPHLSARVAHQGRMALGPLRSVVIVRRALRDQLALVAAREATSVQQAHRLAALAALVDPDAVEADALAQAKALIDEATLVPTTPTTPSPPRGSAARGSRRTRHERT